MVTLDYAQIINTLLVLFGIAGGTGLSFWAKGKRDLHAIRDIFDKIDDAGTNGSITEDQFQSILTDARTIIHGNTLPPNSNKPANQSVSVDMSDSTTTKGN